MHHHDEAVLSSPYGASDHVVHLARIHLSPRKEIGLLLRSRGGNVSADTTRNPELSLLKD
eukprot:527170-Amorphochlora_amoeboformis.AAC.2